MVARILPQDFHFAETQNHAVIQTAVPKELLDDPKMYLSHVRQMRLAAGNWITVQVMNETKDKLLHEADFRVIAAVETQHGIQDDYGSRLRPMTDYQIERKSEWWSSSLAPVEVKPEPERIAETYVGGEGSLKWNVGKGAYDVIVNSEVWTTVERHEGETKEDYKARALGIAAGSLPKVA